MKYLLSSLLISAAIVLAGCIATQPVDDANTNRNQADSIGDTNTAAETNVNEPATDTATQNTNETVRNTNEDATTDVDTSDWLTYTSDEYKFAINVKKEWELKTTESPTWKSRIAEGPAVSFQWFDNDKIILNVFPDGGFDGGSLCSPVDTKDILISSNAVKVHYCYDKTYVFFQEYPDKNEGTFRVVINASYQDMLSNQIIESLAIQE